MPVLNESRLRQAQARAVAAAIVDGAPGQRRFALGDEVELRGSRRARQGATSFSNITRGKYSSSAIRWRLAIVLLALQVAALSFLFFASPLRVSKVEISGNHILKSSVLVAASNVEGENIFRINPNAIEQNLLRLPWVESVHVHAVLPRRLVIQVQEWSPKFWAIGSGQSWLLAPSGAIVAMGNAGANSWRSLPLIVSPADAQPKFGAELLAALQAADDRFPALFGVHVLGYEFDGDGILSLWTSARWRAVLGHVDGPGLGQLAGKLSSLATLRTQLNFANPNFGYVDVENSSSPAVGGMPGFDNVMAAALRQQLGLSVPSATPKATADLILPAAKALLPTPAPASRSALAVPATP